MASSSVSVPRRSPYSGLNITTPLASAGTCVSSKSQTLNSIKSATPAAAAFIFAMPTCIALFGVFVVAAVLLTFAPSDIFYGNADAASGDFPYLNGLANLVAIDSWDMYCC